MDKFVKLWRKSTEQTAEKEIQPPSTSQNPSKTAECHQNVSESQIQPNIDSSLDLSESEKSEANKNNSEFRLISTKVSHLLCLIFNYFNCSIGV